MSEPTQLPASLQTFTVDLQQAGYQSVFDICTLSRSAFVDTLVTVPAGEAQQIYRQARQHANSLKALYRAWQLRHEPALSGLSKLGCTPNEQLRGALVYSIGGDGDFSDLLERSSDYADAASIQSLFSPGRYAAALYRVATALHDSSSALHIDKRRPDLKSLILSETSKNQPVSSLDILLNVLQAGEQAPLKALKQRYFPMTLPYDDSLSQINAALSAQARSLGGVWNRLADSQQQALNEQNVEQPAAAASRSAENVTDGGTFYLQALGEMVYLSNHTSGNGMDLANLTLGKSVSTSHTVPLKLTVQGGGSGDQGYLGLPQPTQGKGMENAYLTGSTSEGNTNDGRYAVMVNKRGAGLELDYHLLVTLKLRDKQVLLKTRRGYIGYFKGRPPQGNEHWDNPLVLDATEQQALVFTLCEDAQGKKPVVNPIATLPDEAGDIKMKPVLDQPSPPTRTTLALTPASYQLLLNDKPSLADITDHFGFKQSTRATADVETIAATLNDVGTFCQKTGLTFNQLLELTAQYAWNDTGKNLQNRGLYQKYGQPVDTVTTPLNYGAVFLNHSYTGNNPLWVEPGKGKGKLNLSGNNSDIPSYPANAEKLIRLRNTTGLSFEMLDWGIVNACTAANFDKIVLDKTVLDALAAGVECQQRYGISFNTFVSFIGAVNPYAPEQQQSFYQTLFSSADGSTTQSLGQKMAAVDHSILCAASGVTEDELTRILSYCGLGDEDIFDERVAGRIYRFGAIPRMLGLSFAQAEALWMLMDGGYTNLLNRLGQKVGLSAIALIRRSEQALAWMADNNLTLLQLQGMVSHQFNLTASAEMFNFLQNLVNSVNAAAQPWDDKLQQKMLRALAGGFGLKSNVMAPLCNWLAAISSFRLADYWSSIDSLFRQPATTLDSLQADETLVLQTQQLSQLVLIARRMELSEQDLTLLTQTPQQLDATWSAVPAPAVALLLLLTRFKRWQQQVTVSRDEALRLLPLLTDAKTEADVAAEKIAAVHGQDRATVQAIGTLLFSGNERPWPQDFSQLWQLLDWLRIGQTLNIGSRTLGDLLAMMRSDPAAESDELIARVANNLSAGISR